MEIAVQAMKVLIQQDFKKLSFSAKTGGHKDIASYIADEAFIFADAMIDRNKIEDAAHDEIIAKLHKGQLK